MYRHFRESRSVDIELMKSNLQSIKDKLNQFPLKILLIWMKHECFIGYKHIIFLKQNNL